ncbi:MAG: ComEC/Rec2 family competence protein [Lachnospiraceae bacterium]|nr:ComEC/Rec2 family competence protein [Lachnospiraceae bacterium]
MDNKKQGGRRGCLILENKRHVCLLALSVIFGTVLYNRSEDVWLPVLLTLGAVILTALLTGKKRRERMVMAGICTILILTAFFRCRYLDLSYLQVQSSAAAGAGKELTGVIYKKEIKSNSYLYYLKTEYKTVLVYADSDEIPVGTAVTAKGETELFSHASNEGAFDLADYYRYRGISFRMFAESVTPAEEPERSLREFLYQLQKKISGVFSSELNARDAGVLSALVTGNRGLMDQEVQELYRDAGISHILAISGLHISILGLGVFRFLRKIRCSYPVSAAAGSAIVVCFVIMSGMGTSSGRALIMYLILMGAEVLGRAYDPLNALAIAALLLLLRNPMNLYQSGFQFSFLAMGAIVLSSQVLTKYRDERTARIATYGRSKDGRSTAQGRNEDGRSIALARSRIRKNTVQGGKEELSLSGRFLRNLGERLLSGAFLQLFLLPLTAWIYYEVPLYALFLNLLVLPLCSWLLGAGLLGGFTGLYFTQLSKWVLILCHFILVFYEKSIALVNCLPFSQVITGKPSAWILFLYYAALVGLCLWYLNRNTGGGTAEREAEWTVGGGTAGNGMSDRKPGTGRAEAGKPDRNGQPGMRGKYPVCMLTGAAHLLPLVLLVWILFVPKRTFCRVDFLDVGQGDGIYLSDGNGIHMMIDGGSSSENEVGSYILEPFLKYHGVKKVHVWILTHGDKDHYSGLLELLEDGYEVEYLLLAKSMPGDEARAALIEAAEANGTEVVFVEAGDSVRLADSEMVCLYPSDEDTGDDTNALSQVWQFERDGMSVLFTGDIGEDQEELLVERGLVSDCVVLKAAHHGSKYSSCADFLEEVLPEYTVISCGEGNSYGHPHAEALERIEDAGSEILQTQDCGQITFYEKNGGFRMRIYNSDD